MITAIWDQKAHGYNLNFIKPLNILIIIVLTLSWPIYPLIIIIYFFTENKIINLNRNIKGF